MHYSTSMLPLAALLPTVLGSPSPANAFGNYAGNGAGPAINGNGNANGNSAWSSFVSAYPTGTAVPSSAWASFTSANPSAVPSGWGYGGGGYGFGVGVGATPTPTGSESGGGSVTATATGRKSGSATAPASPTATGGNGGHVTGVGRNNGGYAYSPLEQIRYTLSQETFLLDTKDWEGLGLVYTDDAVANFTALGAGVWTGLTTIQSNEAQALGAIQNGMHQILSSTITLLDSNTNSSTSTTATVTSYYTFQHFTTSSDGKTQNVWQAWTKYVDEWVDTGVFNGSVSSWRVKGREVSVLGGPVSGNYTISPP